MYVISYFIVFCFIFCRQTLRMTCRKISWHFKYDHEWITVQVMLKDQRLFTISRTFQSKTLFRRSVDVNNGQYTLIKYFWIYYLVWFNTASLKHCMKNHLLITFFEEQNISKILPIQYGNLLLPFVDRKGGLSPFVLDKR